MKIQNGIHVYDQNEQPPIPEGLSGDFEVISPYGFKVTEIEGKKMWMVATEEDYRNVVAQFEGISPDEVSLDVNCFNTSPTGCSLAPCEFAQTCTRMFDSGSNTYICKCTNYGAIRVAEGESM